MAPVSRSTAPVSTPVAGSAPTVNPKVLLAEAIALQCARDQHYLPSAEFKRRVLGFSAGDARNERAHFAKILKRLNPDERLRLLAAQKEATGEKIVAPEYVRQRVLDLTKYLMPSGSLVTANRFYQLLFPGLETVRAPTSIRSLYAIIRQVLPDETRADLDRIRTTATGLEPEKGGPVGVDVKAVLSRAEQLARQVVGQVSTPFTAAEFQRRALDVEDKVTDVQVRRRFSDLLMGMSPEEREQLQGAQTVAMSRVKKAATTKEYDLTGMVERAKFIARDVAAGRSPVPLLEFYQRVLKYDTENLATLKVRASQYAGRLSPEQKETYEEAKAVAIGKKPMSAAEAGQIFAPNVEGMEEAAALAHELGSETFVPTSRLPETLSRPHEPVDPKTLQLPGFVADVMDIVKPLGFPVGTIDWNKFALPPSEGRLHAPVNSADDFEPAVDLPEDLPPPASLASTPLPRVTLDPATVGILVAAGVLVAADGPLPFGDCAAASLVGGRLAVR